MPVLLPVLKWGFVAMAGALGFAYVSKPDDAPETVDERKGARTKYVLGALAAVFLVVWFWGRK